MKKSLYDYSVETDRPDLIAQWDTDKNGSLSPETIAASGSDRAWWRCEKGHEWQTQVCDRSKGAGCPVCADATNAKRIKQHQKIEAEDKLPDENRNKGSEPVGRSFYDYCVENNSPHLLAKWNSLKNGELKANMISHGSHRMVWWHCEKGHEWQARVYRIKAGDACPYCAGRRAIPGETDLATLRPDLMTQWDFEKNSLDPTEVTIASHDKAWWKCELGHSWQAAVFSRTKAEKASGCPYCTGKTVLAGFNDLATLKPKLAEQWYQPLNGELKPEDVTLGSNKKVWWQCNEGHVWQAYIYARTKANGTGCPVCTGTVKDKYAALMSEKTISKSKRKPVEP